jgi:hypothetical protein
MGRDLRISERQVLQVLRDRDRETKPVLATSDVADRTDVSPPTAKDRLDALVEEGVLKTHVYGRVPVYWPADERMTSDPDPISGGLAEKVEEIAQENGEPRPAALRRLVELGLEVEEIGARPSELQAERERVKEERDRVEEDLDKTQEARERAEGYALAGGFVTAGVLLTGLGISLPASVLAGLPFSSAIFNGMQVLGVVMVMAGFVGWVWPFVRPIAANILE